MMTITASQVVVWLSTTAELKNCWEITQRLRTKRNRRSWPCVFPHLKNLPGWQRFVSWTKVIWTLTLGANFTDCIFPEFSMTSGLILFIAPAHCFYSIHIECRSDLLYVNFWLKSLHGISFCMLNLAHMHRFYRFTSRNQELNDDHYSGNAARPISGKSLPS